MPSLRVIVAGRIKDVRTSGGERGTLYLPPDLYARADNDSHANTDFSLEDVDVGDFNTMMCQCRNFGLMVHLIGLAVTRHADGTVTLDVANSNLELFRAVLGLLPRYDAASTDWAAGTIERVLVDRAIQASKETYNHKRGVFPAYVAPGASEIEKLKGAVVPDYGSMKLLDDRLGGDGVRTRCVQFDYNAGFGTCLIKEPLAVVYADAYAIDYEGKEATPGHIFDLIVGSILHGLHIVSDVRPTPVACVRSAVVLFTAVAPFLPAKFAPLARPLGFGDSKIVFKCGPGDWDDRIIAFRLFCWVVFAAGVYGLEYDVPDQVRARGAAEHVAEWCGSETHRTALQAQLVNCCRPKASAPTTASKSSS